MIKIDTNAFGFFFWFVFFGFIAAIFSIIFEPDLFPISLLVSFYGVIGFLLDLLFDRIWLNHYSFANTVKKDSYSDKDFTNINMSAVPQRKHHIRFWLQIIWFLIVSTLITLLLTDIFTI